MRGGDDHGTIFWLLTGTVVLVLSAVGLSLLMDKRFGFSRSQAALEREISAGAAELAEMRAIRDVKQRGLPAAAGSGEQPDLILRQLTTRIRDLRAQADSLVRSRDGLAEAIRELEGRFSEYRRSYRDAAWAAAAGESLPSLVTRGGREFLDVRITRVTPVGIELRHADGVARIDAADLPDAFQDRFQWNDEERREALRLEEANRRKMIDAVPPAPPSAVPDPADQQPEALRGRVAQWRGKMDSLAAELSTARSMQVRGRNTSVPGTLETWEARVIRLEADLNRARLELATARAALARVAPGDPLLHPRPGEE